MDINITFRHMEHTPALDELIKKKTEKLAQIATGAQRFDWTCDVDNKVHRAELQSHINGKDYVAHSESDDLYKAIDLVVKKFKNQLAHGH